MNDRERFLATMRYQPRDRAPICDFKFWEETLPEWKTQGLPDAVNWNNSDEYFGMDNWEHYFPANVGLQPNFGWTKLEDRGDQEVIRDAEGVILLRYKTGSSIPYYMSHTLVDRDSWEREFLPKLNPKDKRIDVDLPAWEAAAVGKVRTFHAGSLYGWIRNWMGMENVSYLVHDDPELFEEIVEHLCNLTCTVLQQAYDMGAKIDALSMWEDMCYNAGPLLSPTHFKQFLVPRYKRITNLAKANGTDVIYLDSDGKIDDLLPLWLEGGITCMFPIEIGTWGADPVRYRKEYGKELRMLGGVDKHALQGNPETIRAAIRHLTPLVEEGGYIPFLDHRIPPDVTVRNYLLYLQIVREEWGHGVNLKPIHPDLLKLLE
ncbi:MAG: uroporphyrinogen decarboxylase family protein [Verrucomicrobiota bacterium]|nr:uroporphyrinogen decarboxylase family protein [Verrucomicrobiota bacterium]